MVLLLDVVKEERSSVTVLVMELRNVPQMLCVNFSCSKKWNVPQIVLNYQAKLKQEHFSDNFSRSPLK